MRDSIKPLGRRSKRVLIFQRKITKALNIDSITVQNHLTMCLEMKSYHTRWAPHILTVAQKAKHKEMVGSVLQSHTISIFPPLVDWWRVADILWIPSWNNVGGIAGEVDELERPSH
jgi:hypothetical protein